MFYEGFDASRFNTICKLVPTTAGETFASPDSSETNIKTDKTMKTIGRIALLATALTVGISSSLTAAPRGKHPVDFATHKHGGVSKVSKPEGDKALLKRIGPSGKGMIRTAASRSL